MITVATGGTGLFGNSNMTFDGTTLTLKGSGGLNMSNNPITNISSALFAPVYAGNPNISAGGTYSTYISGTITYALHVFTTVGAANSFAPSSTIAGAQVLIIAGGGSGGTNCAGGGGAGGLVYLSNYSISAGSYTLAVGAGAVGNSVTGNNSTGFGFTANGGGSGGGNGNGVPGGAGGCGGGGSAYSGPGGSATQVSSGSSPYSGFAGGVAAANPGFGGGGGGGMGSIGLNASAGLGGYGGNGLAFSITGTSVTYCGGGGGGGNVNSAGGVGGTGGGGNGSGVTNGSSATYYGSGGGGGCGGNPAGNGGSGYQGIVIIAYPINQFTGGTPFTVGTIAGDQLYNLTIAPTSNVRLQGPTEWRYMTSNVSGTTVDLTASSNYYATIFRLTAGPSNVLNFAAPSPTLAGIWWTFSNAYGSSQTLTFTGTYTGLTSPYTLTSGSSVTIYSSGSNYYSKPV